MLLKDADARLALAFFVVIFGGSCYHYGVKKKLFCMAVTGGISLVFG